MLLLFENRVKSAPNDIFDLDIEYIKERKGNNCIISGGG